MDVVKLATRKIGYRFYNLTHKIYLFKKWNEWFYTSFFGWLGWYRVNIIKDFSRSGFFK